MKNDLQGVFIDLKNDKKSNENTGAFQGSRDDILLNQHHASSFQDYEHKDISVHSVEIVKQQQTSFNGAVFDASKSVKQRNMKLT